VGLWPGSLEDLAMTDGFWRGKRVFVTGHTGFKGGWLSMWLNRLGAQVHGYALAAPTQPSLFEVARVNETLASHTVGDIRDADALAHALQQTAPDIVFHLAAQPLVRESYRDPVATFSTNAMGTVHLLEAVRRCDSVRAVVSVTTDKCYENKEWAWGYRENEPLGGHDPYSSSKACAELITHAYRQSFLSARRVAVASARAGNVIGGGDWATDRLVPDLLRSADAGIPLDVRHPAATRPWQHVLEPLGGYLLLAQSLAEQGNRFASAWNFGPADEGVRSVRSILDFLCEHLPGATWRHTTSTQVHEAGLLKLDSSKANAELGWTPRWRLADALTRTLDWHKAWRACADMQVVSLEQIAAHQAGAART
jgi:CDP-glucose 4,6-dehydratase